MTKLYDDVLKQTIINFNILGIKGFNPQVTKSEKWQKWITNFSIGTCFFCSNQNGKVYDKNDMNVPKPPIHDNCSCMLKTMLAILAGTATIHGIDGADYWIKKYRTLPDNYVSKKKACNKGWKNVYGNLRKLIPDATIGGDIYKNKSKKLPSKTGRIWYEADVNYTGGYRNRQRLIYSNDGLIFVTYDHYNSFYEIK